MGCVPNVEIQMLELTCVFDGDMTAAQKADNSQVFCKCELLKHCTHAFGKSLATDGNLFFVCLFLFLPNLAVFQPGCYFVFLLPY